MGLEYKTKEALWDAAKKSVEEEAENNYQTNINNAIMDQLVSDSQFTSVPQPLVVRKFRIIMNIWKQSVSASRM